jgi:hypothetical protein
VYAVVLAWSTVYITSYCSDPIALAHFYPIPEVSKTNKLMIHVALPRGRFKTHNQGSHDLLNAPGHLRRLYGNESETNTAVDVLGSAIQTPPHLPSFICPFLNTHIAKDKKNGLLQPMSFAFFSSEKQLAMGI